MCIPYEDGRRGDEDGRGGNEDGRQGDKVPNTYLNIQARIHFDLLQAILGEFSFSKVSGFTVYQQQRNYVSLFPAYLIFPIVNLSYFKEENCHSEMTRNFAPNRKSAKLGLLYSELNSLLQLLPKVSQLVPPKNQVRGTRGLGGYERIYM